MDELLKVVLNGFFDFIKEVVSIVLCKEILEFLSIMYLLGVFKKDVCDKVI